MVPKHINPTDQVARAPYNFVPLPDRIVTIALDDLPLQDRYDSERHTGFIDCTITTETPVYVRCPFTLEEYQRAEQEMHQEAKGDVGVPWRQRVKNLPDFFYTDPAKTPRIPGSSLRGMVRALIEIVGYGKLTAVTNTQLAYRSVGDTSASYRNRILRDNGRQPNRMGKIVPHSTPLAQAGYMHQDNAGNWFIRPAQQVNGTTFARIFIDDIPAKLDPLERCLNAAHIFVQVGPYEFQDVRAGAVRVRFSRVLRMSAQPANGLMPGTLARSGEMATKRTEAVVFPEDEESPSIPIPEAILLAYREQISPEQATLLGKQGVLNEGQPVFYLMERGKLIFFGHTMMMRLPYPHTPLEFVPEHLRKDKDGHVDFAEAIFGYTKATGEDMARAYGGRVFFTDAVLEPGQSDVLLDRGKVITPRILGTPKPTTFQHYLVQTEPNRVEIGQTKDGRPKYEKRLADYAADSPGRTVIRGHKVYWHKGNVTATDVQEESDKLCDEHGKEKEKDTQHTQMKPVRAGVRFKFRLYFDNLSPEELGALVWALTLPGEPGKQYRHSIGMGKPLGLGAIKLEPQFFLTQREQRYETLFDGAGWRTSVQPIAAEDADRFALKFDAYIRKAIGDGGAPSLGTVERIRMLLRLLEWPGPRRELTRYLEIERPDPNLRRGKINEYKERPVLPDPLHIEAAEQRGAVLPPSPRPQTGGWQPRQGPGSAQPGVRPQPPRPGTTTPTTSSPARQGATPAQPVEPAQKAPARQTVVSHPATAAEVEPGMLLEGKVVRTEPARIVVDICGEEATLPKEAISPPVRDDYDLRERFPKEKILRVLVKGRNKAGRIQLIMLRS